MPYVVLSALPITALPDGATTVDHDDGVAVVHDDYQTLADWKDRNAPPSTWRGHGDGELAQPDEVRVSRKAWEALHALPKTATKAQLAAAVDGLRPVKGV